MTRPLGRLALAPLFALLVVTSGLVAFVETAAAQSGPTEISLGDDDYETVTLPFTVNFYGQDYSTVHISSNGYLTFDTDDRTDYTNSDFPTSSSEPSSMVAPFWDDLDPREPDSEIHYQVFSDRIIVQWTEMAHYSYSSRTDRYTFQVVLFENGDAEYRYLSMVGELDSATIGIQSEDKTSNVQIAGNGDTYVANEKAVRVSPNGGSATDVSFTWQDLSGNAPFEPTEIPSRYSGTARFDVTDWSFNKSSVEVGEPVAINVTVENNGGRERFYTAALTADFDNVGRERVAIDRLESHTFNFVVRFDDVDNYQLFMRAEPLGRIDVTPARETAAAQVVDAGNDSRISTRVTDVRGGTPYLVALPITTTGTNTGVDVDSITVTTTRDRSFDLDTNQSKGAPDGVPAPPEGVRSLTYLDVETDLDDEFVENASFEFTVRKNVLGSADPTNVAVYRYEGSELTELDVEVVDETETTVTLRAPSPGFSMFAVGLKEAVLSVANAQVQSRTVQTGERLLISGSIQNTGPVDGTFDVALTIDGQFVENKSVTVLAGSARSVNFRHTFDEAGTYQASLAGVTAGNVTVEEAAQEMTPTETPEPTATPEPTVTPEPESTPADSGAGAGNDETTATSGPGFTVVLVVVALLALAGLAVRRRPN